MQVYQMITGGGPIVYLLILINIVGVATILWKFFTLKDFRTQLSTHIDQFVEKFDKLKLDKNDSASIVILKDHIADDVQKLETGLGAIKMIATIAPLMGLLGTVWGILTSFKVISEVGLNNPALFASGISTALITTVAGLVVAIIHYVGHQYLSSQLDALEGQLEKTIVPKIFGKQGQ